MTRSKRPFLLAALAAQLCGGAVAAHADADQTLLDKINPAWQRLDMLSQPYLTDVEQKRMYDLAYATATEQVCRGFKVDEERFIAAFKTFDGERYQDLSPENRRERERKLLVLFGMATGLLSAEGLLAKDRFCEAAQTVKDDPERAYWK